ncbi:MAG: hypothetical protein HY782_20720 [Chloroflexi bacterium]|nr:hypothetical protein [Chloroflexota bacterium]
MASSNLKSFAKSGLWHHALFLALILFSLRDALALPGTIGHTWDWEIPLFADQIREHILRYVFIWDYQFRGGFYSPYRPEGLYYLLSYPLAFLGGEMFTRVILIVFMFIAATTMRRLAARVLGLTPWWSTVAGILYMLSPSAFSRIVAGHMHILFPFAILPLLFELLWRSMEDYRAGRRLSLRHAVGAGLVLGLEGIHPSMFLIAVGIAGLVILFHLMRLGLRRNLVAGIVITAATCGLVSAFWALPVGIGYASGGALFHSGWPPQEPEKVTAASVLSQRETIFEYAAQPMWKALRQYANSDITTEYIYPPPAELATLWFVASFLLPIFAFAALLDRGDRSEARVVLAIIGLAGATIVAGASILTGAALSQWLRLYVFPVWAQFGDPVRALPLLSFSYAALAPACLQRWSEQLPTPRRQFVAVPAILMLLVYTSPFLSGSKIVDPREPLLLRAYQPVADEQALYDYLKNDSEDFRVSYVAPPWMLYPEYYDLGYEWIGGLSPRPEFFVPYANPAAWENAAGFRYDAHAFVPGKLLGLGSVKYVLYPAARFTNPWPSTFPPIYPPQQDFSIRAGTVERRLAAQRNLVPVTVPFTATKILRNENYLPRVYAASRSTVVAGDSGSLAALADSGFFERQPALFFDAQQATADRPRLGTLVDNIVNPFPASLQTDRNSSYLITLPPYADKSASLSIAQNSAYVVRVQATPFQTMEPNQADTRAATFEKSAPIAEATWEANSPYAYAMSADTGLRVSVYLARNGARDEYAQILTPVEPINLKDHADLGIVSQVENAAVQTIVAQLGLDFDGDAVADAVWSSPPISHATAKFDRVNAFELVRREFPDKPEYNVIAAGVRFQVKPQDEWAKTNYLPRLYEYTLKELRLGADQKSGWTLSLPAEFKSGPTVTLSRSLENLDAQNQPILLEYQSDGPATIYADIEIVAQNGAGVTQTIPVGNRLIGPFSQGVVTLDARDQLAAQGPWRATRVLVRARQLRASPELRPTTLTLTRVGAEWTPETAERIPNPVLLLDGQPIALTPLSSDADHLRYTSAELTLTAGQHEVTAAFPDAQIGYRVESIEVEPAARQSEPRALPSIVFEKINPTRYRVHVANVQAPFFLVFNESFHADWKAYVEKRGTRWYEPSALLSWLFDGGGRSEIQDHYLANGYANSWYVAQTGSYDVVFEFTPQRLYEGGWLVSLTTLVGGVVLIVVLWFRELP